MNNHKVNELLINKKALFLALDQGLEHGPSDFTTKNIDPEYILDIAYKGNYNAIILQKGLAEKYYENYKYKVPLILKLNGKTSLSKDKGDPYSPQICSVNYAVKLGASAIGYTIYPGSYYESEMFKEFSKIQEEAREYDLPVIVWSYPRGHGIDENDNSTIAYGARTALELGADLIKIKYNGNKENFKWIVKCAGRSKIFVSGGTKIEPKNFIQETYEVMQCGASGIAVGRNIWQAEEPLKLTRAMKEIIFENKKPEQVMRLIK